MQQLQGNIIVKNYHKYFGGATRELTNEADGDLDNFGSQFRTVVVFSFSILKRSCCCWF